jgi:hypothetical protein
MLFFDEVIVFKRRHNQYGQKKQLSDFFENKIFFLTFFKFNLCWEMIFQLKTQMITTDTIFRISLPNLKTRISIDLAIYGILKFRLFTLGGFCFTKKIRRSPFLEHPVEEALA